MSPVQRDLAPEVRVFALGDERRRVDEQALVARNGRNARTLLKDGSLRVTLVVLGAGGAVDDHHADGPITIQPLDGRIRVTAHGLEHELGPGALLSLGAGVTHAVASEEGAAFLLTIALPDASSSTED